MGTSFSCPTDCLQKSSSSTMPAVAARSRAPRLAAKILGTSHDNASDRIALCEDLSWGLQPRCSILWRADINPSAGVDESLQIDHANLPPLSPQSPASRASSGRKGSEACIFKHSVYRDSVSAFSSRAPFLEPPPRSPYAFTSSTKGLGAVKLHSDDTLKISSSSGSALIAGIDTLQVETAVAVSAISVDLFESTTKGRTASSRTDCSNSPETVSDCNRSDYEAVKGFYVHAEPAANELPCDIDAVAVTGALRSDCMDCGGAEMTPCEASIDQPAARVRCESSSLADRGGDDIKLSSQSAEALAYDLKEEMIAEHDRAVANHRLAAAALHVLAVERLTTQPPSLKRAQLPSPQLQSSTAPQNSDLKSNIRVATTSEQLSGNNSARIASVAELVHATTNEAARLPPSQPSSYRAPRRSQLSESSSPVLASSSISRRRLRPRPWAAGSVSSGSNTGRSRPSAAAATTAAWPFAGMPPVRVGATQAPSRSVPDTTSSRGDLSSPLQPMPLPKSTLRPFHGQATPAPRLDPGFLSSPRLCAHSSAAASAAAMHYLLPHPPTPIPPSASPQQTSQSSGSPSSSWASQRYGCTPRSSANHQSSRIPSVLSPSALVLGDLAAMGRLADFILLQLCDELADELCGSLSPEARANLSQSSARFNDHSTPPRHVSTSDGVARELEIAVDPLHASTPLSNRPLYSQPHSAPAALASSSINSAAAAAAAADRTLHPLQPADALPMTSPSTPFALAWSPRPSRSPAQRSLPLSSLATSTKKVVPMTSSSTPLSLPALFSPRTPLSPFTPSSPPPPSDSINQDKSSSSDVRLECRPDANGDVDGEDEDDDSIAATMGRAGRESFEEGLLSPHLAALLDDSDGDRFVSGGGLDSSMPSSWADEASLDEEVEDGAVGDDRARWRPRVSSRQRSGHFDDLFWSSPASPHDTPLPNRSPLPESHEKGHTSRESFDDHSPSLPVLRNPSHAAAFDAYNNSTADTSRYSNVPSSICRLDVPGPFSPEAEALQARAISETGQASSHNNSGPDEPARGNNRFREEPVPFSLLEEMDGAVPFRHAPCP